MGLLHYANGVWRAEEEHFALDYPLPALQKSLLDLHVDNPAGIPRMQDRLLGARVDDIEIDGDEESILKGIDAVVRSKDPDVLMTDGGDAFLMPYLAAKASEFGVNLQLGRDPDRFASVKAKSYFTYGKIVYKPGQYILRGRLHLDRGHFAFRESDFAGLAELSRLSTLTPQEQARLTPGTAFSAMQVNQAYHDGCLVVWKKNRPEDFKDAENLLRGDRGGFTFEPEVGVHEGLYELDFSSLYPSIMVKYNISAETLDCSCCELDGLPVPELRYHLCTRRVGIVGRVLKPLIERRRYYKKMKKEPGPLQDVYTGRDTILKWTLVTCFSADTLIPYRLNGKCYIDRIEDVVNRYLPNRTGTVSCKDELRVLGFDNHLHPEEKRIAKVMKAESPKELLKVKIKGSRELLVTPNHRFFVFTGAKEFEVRTADELRAGDLVPISTRALWERTTSATINLDGGTAQEFEDMKPRKTLFEFLPIISIEVTPYENPYVYCFEVENDLHGFVTADGTFVGQSFGYQGYKNARFGRIECHEAINAYARDILVRTMEIAESHGYEVVHGIVDSVWLRPKAVDILRWTAKCVLDRAIPVHQFILTKSVSRTLTEYVVLTATAAALKQLEKRGFPVEPGESVRYVLMDARARDSERKVRVAEFLQGDEAPDAWEYIKLLARSGQTLLAPFGYTEDKLFAMCQDLSDLSRTDLPDRAIAIQEDYKSAGESRSKARGGVGYKKPWRILADPEGGPEE